MQNFAFLSSEKYRILRSWLVFAAIGAAAYFANVEIQSYFGRKALAETGLELLTLEQAFHKAEQENKLVLADMSAIWCSTCRSLDTNIFSNEMIKTRIDASFVFSRIEFESDEGEQFMETYGVRGFPTVLVLNSDGSVVRHLPFTLDPVAYAALLDSVL